MEQGLQGRRRREGDNFFCNAIIFLILMLMMLLFQLPIILLFSSFVRLLNPTTFASALSCKCAHTHTEQKGGPAVRGLLFGDHGYSSSFATDC